MRIDAGHRDEVLAVYAAGLVQGLALVTFPAAATILTSPADYGLSSSAYGSLFLPQAVMAVLGSLLGGPWSRRDGLKRVLLVGLVADLVAMILLVASQVGMGTALAYSMLLVATASLGFGFGLTVPTLTTFAGGFFPQHVDRAVLVLNALLGLGTFLAPVLAALFLGLGVWWALPAGVALALLVLLLAGLRLPLEVMTPARGRAADGARVSTALPRRLWLYVGFALLYGVVETVNGNWATVYMSTDLGASASVATIALAAFWGMVTVGRLLFASLERQVPERTTFRVLPLVAAAALFILALLPFGSVSLGVMAFGLAGLGCSALLPLTLSFGGQEFAQLGAAAAGILFAAYQVGYGLAAFGVGPLEDLGWSLGAIYAIGGATAIVLAVLSVRVVGGRSRGSTLSPETGVSRTSP